MEEKHYKKEISAFLHHELPADEHRAVGEHILHCQECRKEHDEIKLGARLAEELKRLDAPSSVWRNVEKSLDKAEYTRIEAESGIPHWRKFTIGFASIIAVLGLTAGAYFYLSSSTEKTGSAAIKKTESHSDSEVAWNVKPLTGNSKIAESLNGNSLKIGASLETDENSRAEIEVADIGQVEVAPNSLVRLVNSTKSEHRLSLERGRLSARIYAPPRLFVVDTPSAVAVDLGCAYDLDVDEEGNSRLHVTSGYVALEREGLESIVPAGAICFTKRGKGLGTPFAETASQEFREELRKFDFDNGGIRSLAKIIKLAKARDTLSLWHLISRVSKKNREKVLDKTLIFVKLPEGVTRKGILRLDKNMLEKLRFELENLWYE